MVRKRHYYYALIIVVVIASATLARGNLPNQTAQIFQLSGTSFESFTANDNATSISLSPSNWQTATPNSTISEVNGSLVLTTNLTASSDSAAVRIAENTGLKINLTKTPFAYITAQCPIGLHWSVAMGWTGWNESSLTAITQRLSTYQYILAGLEIEKGIIWLNVPYPVSDVSCSGSTQIRKFNLGQEITELGLSNSMIKGLQVKLIDYSPQEGSFDLSLMRAEVSNSSSYYQATQLHGIGERLADDSIAFLGEYPSNLDSYSPDRVYIQYDLDAISNMQYTIFAMINYHGNVTIWKNAFLFYHEAGNQSIGTYIDIITPVTLPNSSYSLEPLASIVSNLKNNQIAILFFPVNNTSPFSAKIQFVQLTVSSTPFYSRNFAMPSMGSITSATLDLMYAWLIIPTTGMTAMIILAWKKKISDKRVELLGIFAGALLLRLIIAPFSASADTQVFAEIGALYYQNGIIAAQWVSFPGYTFLEIIAYLPYALLRTLHIVDFRIFSLPVSMMEAFFTKLVAIISDIGIGIYLWLISSRFFPKRSALVTGLYLINPVSVYVSAVYGQFDPLFIFVLIAGVYHFFFSRRKWASAIILGFAALINPLGLLAFIPTTTWTARESGLKQGFKFAGIMVSILAIGLLPFAFYNASPVFLTSADRLFSGVPGEKFVESVLSFNFYGTQLWNYVGYGLNYRGMISNLPNYSLIEAMIYPAGAGILFLVFTILLLWKTLRASKMQAFAYTMLYLLGMFAVFQLTYILNYIQYVVWITALSLTIFAIIRNKIFLTIAIIIEFLVGTFYIFLEDNPVERATGLNILLVNAGVINDYSADIAVVYSILLTIVAAVTIATLIRLRGKELSDQKTSSLS